MFTTSPVSAVYPTIPVPKGILISSNPCMSSSFDSAFTSNTLETRYRGPSFGPWRRKSEQRSPLRRILTFCRILWQRLFTSKSFEISLTSSINNSFSSSCSSSTRDLRFRCGERVLEGSLGERNVACPSTTFTKGFKIPLPSNSEAEIFRTGVEVPEAGGVPLGVGVRTERDWSQESIRVLLALRVKYEWTNSGCSSSHASIFCSMLFPSSLMPTGSVFSFLVQQFAMFGAPFHCTFEILGKVDPSILQVWKKLTTSCLSWLTVNWKRGNVIGWGPSRLSAQRLWILFLENRQYCYTSSIVGGTSFRLLKKLFQSNY